MSRPKLVSPSNSFRSSNTSLSSKTTALFNDTAIDSSNKKYAAQIKQLKNRIVAMDNESYGRQTTGGGGSKRAPDPIDTASRATSSTASHCSSNTSIADASSPHSHRLSAHTAALIRVNYLREQGAHEIDSHARIELLQEELRLSEERRKHQNDAHRDMMAARNATVSFLEERVATQNSYIAFLEERLVQLQHRLDGRGGSAGNAPLPPPSSAASPSAASTEMDLRSQYQQQRKQGSQKGSLRRCMEERTEDHKGDLRKVIGESIRKMGDTIDSVHGVLDDSYETSLPRRNRPTTGNHRSLSTSSINSNRSRRSDMVVDFPHKSPSMDDHDDYDVSERGDHRAQSYNSGHERGTMSAREFNERRRQLLRQRMDGVRSERQHGGYNRVSQNEDYDYEGDDGSHQQRNRSRSMRY